MEKIYNITAAVDADIAGGWLDEVISSFLPTLMAVPGVLNVELIEVQAPEAPKESRTFTVQIRFADPGALETFLAQQERRAEKRLFEKFGSKYVTFRLQLDSLHRL